MSAKTFLLRLTTDETGATAIEYGLIVGLIAIASLVGLSSMASSNTDMWHMVAEKTVAVMDF